MDETTAAEIPTSQRWSALFLLDFVGRYAVDRCGATDDLVTAVASVACVLPSWIWVATLALSLVRVELYWVLARHSVVLITGIVLLLVALYDAPPPVYGCGPAQSYPCPQTALSAYGFALYMCYERTGGAVGTWTSVFATLQLVVVAHAVLWVGFASPASVLAGVAVGATCGCLVHVAAHHTDAAQQGGYLIRGLGWLERTFGRDPLGSVWRTATSGNPEPGEPKTRAPSCPSGTPSSRALPTLRSAIH